MAEKNAIFDMLSRAKAWVMSRLWPFVVGLFAMAAAALLLRPRKSITPERTPAQRRQLERDNEVLHTAIEENVGVADIAQTKADQAGARAEYFGHAASDAKQRLKDMTEADRQAAVKRAKERLRRGGLRIVLVGALMSAAGARADEPMQHPRTGVTGWWMDREAKLEIDGWILELDIRRMQTGELRAQSDELAVVSTRTRTALLMCTTLQAATEKRLLEADKRGDELAAWYRHPRFVGVVSFVAGIALVSGVVWAVQ